MLNFLVDDRNTVEFDFTSEEAGGIGQLLTNYSK